MNIVKKLLIENCYNAENKDIIEGLVTYLSAKYSSEYDELESVETDNEGNVLFNFNEDLINDDSIKAKIRDEFFTEYKIEAKFLYPDLF